MSAVFLLSGCIFSQNQAPTTDLSRQSQIKTPLPSQHIVRSGETLFAIAWRYDIDYRDIARLNNINKDFLIFPGQALKLTGRRDSSTIGSFNRGPALTKPIANKSPTAVVSNTPKKTNVSRPVTRKASPSSSKNTRPEKKSTIKKAVTASRSSSGGVFWQWPSDGKVLTNFSSKSTGNKGIDLSGKKGDSVVAAASGRVVYAGSGLRGYGQLIIIKHNDAYLSAYAHNSRLRVKEGQEVKVGQRIADMGSSGSRANTTRLHFEIRRNGKPINPLPLLPKRKN